MDPDAEVKRRMYMRPPSSYGSMKSEDEEEEEEELKALEYKDKRNDTEHPEKEHAPQATGMQLNRSYSPETIYTMTTQQPPVEKNTETSCEKFPDGEEMVGEMMGDDEEEDYGEEMEDGVLVNSPEPPEFVEIENDMQTDENGQPGRLHPEQDLCHIFKNIQKALSGLNEEELLKFKMWFVQWEPAITRDQVMDGDVLDFVDKILEILGQDRSLLHTLNTLESVKMVQEAEELRRDCRRALIRFNLAQYLIRKYHIIREGVVQAGKHNLLNTVYVEPQISTCGYGGVDPSHELRSHPPSPLQFPSDETFVSLNNLFRLQTAAGQPVRTVLTTGIAGIGMSVSVAKFCLDWAEMRANRDLQFVIKLSFRAFWYLRNKKPESQMSITEVIEYFQPECKGMTYLEEEDCRFLIIMDSFDWYQDSLDWKNAPVINDNHTPAHPSVLIVNIIRGTVLRGARVWILGRRAAVSQIPPEFIDVVTEIQGFNPEMRDAYLTRRFSDTNLAQNIVAHYKRHPMLTLLARQPFVCWMVATVFERCYRYQGYGVHPPRLTPFYINILIVQINRRLQFYYGKTENDLKWSDGDKRLVTMIGKMAFKMLGKKTSEFYEEDVKECDLNLTEVTVWSGLCTELPTAAPDRRRKFCFIHFTVQEFMAALYVFTMFHTESKNVLDQGSGLKKILQTKNTTKSTAGLIQCALNRTYSSALGDYDMFLRFLCGILSPDCHRSRLTGYLYHHNNPKLSGLDEVQRLLEQKIQSSHTQEQRVENLRECLREMTQEDE